MHHRFKLPAFIICIAIVAGMVFTGCNNADEQKQDTWIPVEVPEGIVSGDVLIEYNNVFRSSYTDDNGVTRATEISCFFSSYYDRPEDIDLSRFLKYCPLGEPVTDEEEFQEVKKTADFEFGSDTLRSMPTPLWKYYKEEVDSLLLKYSGITTDDLSGGLHYLKDTVYVESQKAFYNCTSDFGPGSFAATKGMRQGNLIILTDSKEVTLTIEINNGYPLIRSFAEGE